MLRAGRMEAETLLRQLGKGVCISEMGVLEQRFWVFRKFCSEPCCF